MNLRWKIKNRIKDGVMMIKAEALINGILIQYCPWKNVSAPATVRFSGSSISTTPRMNWFQVQIKMITASAEIDGIAKGK